MNPIVVMTTCFLQGMIIWVMTMGKTPTKPIWFTFVILLFAGIDVAMVQNWPVITATLTIGALFIFGMLVAEDLNEIIRIYPTRSEHRLRSTIQ